MNDRRIPRVALMLGVAGLVPFVLSAGFSLSTDAPTSALALKSLAAYAAVILSFLGGVRWGVLLQEPTRFELLTPAAISVLPSILAWVSLLLNTVPMLVLLLAGLLMQYLIDSPFSPGRTAAGFPPWYPRLRLLLSTGAVVCVATGLVASL